MFRRAVCILSLSVIILSAGGCRDSQNLGDLGDEASDGVWRAGSTAESKNLKTVDYTVAKGFTDDVNQKLAAIKSGGVSLESMQQWKLMTDEMITYDLEQDSLSEYVGALHKAADCLYGFYLFNSTDTMLKERLTELSEVYSRIGKLEQTTIIPAEDELWVTASSKFKEYGETR